MNKLIKSRVKNKFDTIDGWKEIWESFIPLKGEICIFSIPANVEVDGLDVCDIVRHIQKVGDGQTSLKNLPWSSAVCEHDHKFIGYDEFQELTESEKQQARDNIGVVNTVRINVSSTDSQEDLKNQYDVIVEAVNNNKEIIIVDENTHVYHYNGTHFDDQYYQNSYEFRSTYHTEYEAEMFDVCSVCLYYIVQNDDLTDYEDLVHRNLRYIPLSPEQCHLELYDVYSTDTQENISSQLDKLSNINWSDTEIIFRWNQQKYFRLHNVLHNDDSGESLFTLVSHDIDGTIYELKYFYEYDDIEDSKIPKREITTFSIDSKITEVQNALDEKISASTFNLKNGTADGSLNLVNVPREALDFTATDGSSSAEATGAVAVGYRTHATGKASFSSGVESTASGHGAQSLGAQTVAAGYGSFATGKETKAYGFGSHTEGNNTVAGDPDHVYTGSTRPTSEADRVGAYAHAEGNSTNATGEASHAEGQYTFAVGYASHAEGTADSAAGDKVISSGDASHAEGYAGTASGNYSHKEGFKGSASGTSSHAEGSETTASGSASHAEGTASNATANNAHAEGNSTTASGSDSHAEGLSTEASGNRSHAEGWSTVAAHDATHAEGKYTTANKPEAHAEGYGTVAGTGDVQANNNTTSAGFFTHAEGHATKASGHAAHSEGIQTQATGRYSHAEGNHTIASGEGAHAGGIETVASGHGSHASGISTSALGDYQVVSGKYNIPDFGYGEEGDYPTVYKGQWDGRSYRKNEIVWSDGAFYRFLYTPEDEEYYAVDTNEPPVIGTIGWQLVDLSTIQTYSTYAHIVGNGTLTNPSNAHTVDWNGNAWYAGDVYVAQGVSNVQKKLATEEYVDSKSLNIDLTSGTGSNSIQQTTGLATGNYAVALGEGASASGTHAYAHGKSTQALGADTNVLGIGTVALNARETVVGRYNIPTVSSPGYNRSYLGEWQADTTYNTGECVCHDSTYYLCTKKHTSGAEFDGLAYWKTFSGTIASSNVFTVGNGSSASNRHNAFEVRQDGSGIFAGDVYSVNGKLATEQFVNSSIQDHTHSEFITHDYFLSDDFAEKVLAALPVAETTQFPVEENN